MNSDCFVNGSPDHMIIAIDFDETLTADSKLWQVFIETAKQLEHRVVCVTARRDTEENRETVREWMRSHGIAIPVYFTSLGSKVEYMQRLGIKVGIWIDDDPRRCALGH